MSEYTFTKVPSNASVASFVTLLVCAWFTAAAVAIAAEQPVERITRAKPTNTQHVQAPVIAPRETIVVTAQRQPVEYRETIEVSAQRVALVAPREVITVVAKRSTARVS